MVERLVGVKLSVTQSGVRYSACDGGGAGTLGALQAGPFEVGRASCVLVAAALARRATAAPRLPQVVHAVIRAIVKAMVVVRAAAGERTAPVGSMGRSHELLLGALGADDVVGVRDEAPADQRRLAGRADEAVVVPVAVLERDEAGAADACRTRKQSFEKTLLARKRVQG